MAKQSSTQLMRKNGVSIALRASGAVTPLAAEIGGLIEAARRARRGPRTRR